MGAASFSTPVLDGRFLLLERIGTGGMGAVFRAFDRLEERWVALKVLRREEPSNPPETLAEEFRAWAALHHPFIVRAHEFRTSRDGPVSPGTPYLVLEYVRGLPVHRVLSPGTVPPATLEEFARRVLSALDHVHAAGLVHRDLKPGNILVGRSRGRLGRVKLTDFGLAAPAGVRREFGRFSGSLPYMAPESVLGAPLDGRVDLYALGVILHLLSAGRLPFDVTNPESVIRWHLERGAADPRESGAKIPERLARFIVRLTRRSPQDRPRDARQALEALGAPRLQKRTSVVLCRGARAIARIAFDAAKRGEPRVVPLPKSRGSARGLAREIGAAAQLEGFVVHTLRPGGKRNASNLARLVLRTLLEDEEAVRGWTERFRSTDALPLHLLGGLPLRDRSGRPGRADASGPPAALPTAVAELWLRLARGPGLLLIVEAGVCRDPQAEAAVVEFRRLLETTGSSLGIPARALVLTSPVPIRRRESSRSRLVRPVAIAG